MPDREPDNLLPSELPADPMPIAHSWFDEACAEKLRPNPNAMTLATASTDGVPSARIVLCKQFVADPGYLVFFTNYRSRKAHEAENGNGAAALFHWDAQGRQMRIEGPCLRSPLTESDTYFVSRPAASQLGAWASDQSQPVASRAALLTQSRERASALGVSFDGGTASIESARIPRPPHWGGFRLWAARVELWVQGDARIHDRAEWTRQLQSNGDSSFIAGEWESTRLQP